MKKLRNSDLFIQGKRIFLRTIKESDINRKYLKWMHDQQVNQYLEIRFEKWSKSKIKKYIKDIKNNPAYLFLAIIFKEGDKHIGNVKIGPINRIHKFAEIGIIIGEKEFWGKGLATEAIKLVTDYCFNNLGLYKLTAGAYKNNAGSIKVFKKSGFKIEGIRKMQYLYRGSYTDAVLLGIVKS